MKKLLLVIAAAVCLTQAGYAQKSFLSHPVFKAENASLNKSIKKVAPQAEEAGDALVFSYCEGFDQGLGVGQAGVDLKGAMEIPAETAQSWGDAEIVKINVGYGSAAVRSITLFITEALNGTPLYSQTATISKLNDWNEFELETPFKIEGKKFFVGYQVRTRSVNDYPIGVDGVPTASKLGDYIAVGNQWDHIGADFGNISIQIVVTGDNLPKNDVAVAGLQVPLYVKPGVEFAATARIRNAGANKVTSMTGSVTVGNKTFDNLTIELPEGGLEGGGSADVTINGLSSDQEGGAVPVTLTVNTVNGVEDTNTANNVASASLLCLTEGYPRNVVVEEWTGTWCGWCVRGLVGMNYMRENYGDEGFIGIGVHAGNTTPDPMEVSSYMPFIYAYADGFPGCIVNRKYILDPNTDDLRYCYNYERNIPALAQVELKATYEGDLPQNFDVTANVKFAADESEVDYRLAFVIIQNNMGPYPQTNYYAGGSYGAMDGWENKGSRVSTYFNDVARDIFVWNGIAESIPANVTKNTDYTYTTSISTSNVTDFSQCEVIALVINGITGYIENGVMVKPVDAETSVSDVLAGGLTVNTVPGGVVVNGDCRALDIYSVDGKKVVATSANGFARVAPGMYIVKAVGADNKVVTKKVSVR
ncbi:MAG: Omp28-related outer membrane protein [Muribaculaceae bacterium]|nr:Omp28-related outer membrane protein [Muribaculaceae bacterium]